MNPIVVAVIIQVYAVGRVVQVICLDGDVLTAIKDVDALPGAGRDVIFHHGNVRGTATRPVQSDPKGWPGPD